MVKKERFLITEAEPIKETYAKAGVNINIAAKAKKLISKHARSTLRPEVLSGVGFFGGLFELKGYTYEGKGIAVDKSDDYEFELTNPKNNLRYIDLIREIDSRLDGEF